MLASGKLVLQKQREGKKDIAKQAALENRQTQRERKAQRSRRVLLKEKCKQRAEAEFQSTGNRTRAHGINREALYPNAKTAAIKKLTFYAVPILPLARDLDGFDQRDISSLSCPLR